MKRFRVLAGLALLFLIVAPAKADDILYFVDGNNGTDEMAAALATLSGDTVTVATSPTDFATKIASNTYNLGILSAQQSYGPDYSNALAALGTFVSGGGNAIVDSWFTPLGADLAPFDAAFTSNTNLTSMNLTSFNSGVTNPVAVSNQLPPYATFSDGLTALSGGTVAGTFDATDAAIIVGNGGHSIVNGFLNDTASAAGEQIYINEIDSLLAPTTTVVTPEPGTLGLFSTGLLTLAGMLRRRQPGARS